MKGTLHWADTHGRRRHPECPFIVANSQLPGPCGLGVFTLIDIPAHCWVTPYDGPTFVGSIDVNSGGQRIMDYAFQLNDMDTERRRVLRPRPRSTNQTQGGTQTLHQKLQPNTTYVLGVGPRTMKERASLKGCLTPMKRSRFGRGFGHMLNDAIHSEVTGFQNNCSIRIAPDSNRAFVYSECEISAGSELLTCYHVTYWAGRATICRHLPQPVQTFCKAMWVARTFLKKMNCELEDYVGEGTFVVRLEDGRLEEIALGMSTQGLLLDLEDDQHDKNDKHDKHDKNDKHDLQEFVSRIKVLTSADAEAQTAAE